MTHTHTRTHTPSVQACISPSMFSLPLSPHVATLAPPVAHLLLLSPPLLLLSPPLLLLSPLLLLLSPPLLIILPIVFTLLVASICRLVSHPLVIFLFLLLLSPGIISLHLVSLLVLVLPLLLLFQVQMAHGLLLVLSLVLRVLQAPLNTILFLFLIMIMTTGKEDDESPSTDKGDFMGFQFNSFTTSSVIVIWTQTTSSVLGVKNANTFLFQIVVAPRIFNFSSSFWFCFSCQRLNFCLEYSKSLITQPKCAIFR